MVGADKAVLGVVGHMNSGVAIPSSEVYEKNNLVMVSPTNTATEVTDRKLKSVNRICARDDFQGPAGAEYAVQTLKAKSIFLLLMIKQPTVQDWQRHLRRLPRSLVHK
ncbi:hypothetical protein GCM10020331_050320 [Ectobacillus funiculus]